MRAGSPEALAQSALRALPIKSTEGRVGLPHARFDKLLIECVDTSLEDLLGTKVRATAYGVLERNYSIARNDIPKKPDEFGSCLDQIFGVAGKVIARAIARRLYSQLGLEFVERPEYRFHDYIRIAKR